MKYLKSFETEASRQAYGMPNDMVSYVQETDLVYIGELYKVASVTMTFKDNSSFGYYIPVYGGVISRESTSTRSSIDKITVNGKPIDMGKLSYEFYFSSDYINTFFYAEQEKTIDGHDLYNVKFINKTCWLDFDNGIVRLAEDNSQAVYVSNGTDIPAGEYPLYCENPYEIYVMNGSSKFTWGIGCGIEWGVNPVIPFENWFEQGEYVIELYSKDKDVKFDFAQNTPSSDNKYEHSNYTITKNVKYIGKLVGSSTIGELTYEGTIAEFEAIEKVEKWNVYYTSPRNGDYKSVTVVHCSDGDLNV